MTSKKKLKKKKKDILDNKLPKLAKIFQLEKASGYSAILLGIPDNPKKCIGKNVIFTPQKKVQKNIKDVTFQKLIPNNFSNQKKKPLNIAKTAPIDNT